MWDSFEYCGVSFYDFEDLSVASFETFCYGTDLIELESFFVVELTIILIEKLLVLEIALANTLLY